MAFLYNNKEKALTDLKLFSTMNANEGKALYMKKTKDNKYVIESKTFHDDVIEAMAFNGKVFLPTE